MYDWRAISIVIVERLNSKLGIKLGGIAVLIVESALKEFFAQEKE